MAEFKLGRIRFIWKGSWTASTVYLKDDVIRHGGKTYICVIGHTADSNFYTDLDNIPTRWNQMSDGTDWKDNWTVSTFYKLNDLVKYGGNIYICTESHTSASTPAIGLEADQLKWDIFAEGFDWKGTWNISIRYKVNDIVRYGGISYVCNTGHTSAGTTTLGLEQNQSNWDVYSKTFDWKGEWVVSTRYKVNDIIKYGGTTYVCNTGHTSAGTATLGLENDQSKWDYFNRGLEYKTNWSSASVRYKVNDIVKYGSGLFICITDHTSATSFDESKWTQFVEALEFDNSWSPTVTYQQGDLVTYGGYVYIAKTINLAQRPTTNSDDWDLFVTGFNFRGDWGDDSTQQDYRVGDVVRLNGYTYVAIDDNNNQQPPNVTYWSRLNSGIYWRNTWANATEYELGDAVIYGPNSYICIQGHVSNSGTNRPDVDILGTYWNLLASGADTEVLTTTGDLVYYSLSGPARLPIGAEGQLLRVTSGLPDWEYFGIIPSLYYVSTIGIDLPAPNYGVTLDRPWKTIRYATDQIERGPKYPNAKNLLERNRVYIQKEVTAWINAQIAGNIAPFVTGFTYDSAKCERDIGYIVDALVHDLGRGGNSRSRNAALEYVNNAPQVYILGQSEETVAAINYALEVIDAVISNSNPTVVYQSPVLVTRVNDATKVEETEAQGILDSLVEIITDAITAGVSTNIPGELISNYTISIKTGLFTETLPIIVPQSTALVGDELRSTRVEPSTSLIHTTDASISLSSLNRIKDIVDEIVQNTPVTPTTGNSETQVTSRPSGTGAQIAAVNVLDSAIDYIDYYINSVGLAPSLTGTNTPVSTQANYNAALILEENKEFLAAEAVAWANNNFKTTCSATTGATDVITCSDSTWMTVNLAVRFTGTTFGNVNTGTTYYVHSTPSSASFKISLTRGGSPVDLSNGSGTMNVAVYYNQDLCKRDIREFIDALKYDLIYTGNYRSLWAAKMYTNAVTGSITKDMFYVRNGSGIRNMTVAGLTGTLSAPNSYGTKRPTAGAYVSLDPGWGTTDERVWISHRSPYIQNVTTFGTGATGVMVDGALHAGGNDSIVANDFTQVISDGIGAWATNLGRMELVSVFSYYAHIGYLSEEGGKIRATNGNSSYGDYGTVAEGVDATETPITAIVNNRAFEAVVGYVQTSGSQVQRLEYINAGQDYTSATITINGPGVNATTVGNEIRDGGVFEVRIVDPGDSSTPGGTEYITISNNAQSGNTTSINLAATDTADSADYVGMRIVIASGTGAGQFGYINTYNSGSKLATILKESTGTAGWDHVIPGTTIASSLDLTTVYEIEPRLTFTSPGFTATARTLPASSSWDDISYNSGTVSYTNVAATSGSGAGATFNVVKTNGIYRVTINNRGTSYTNGNTLTIAGANVGGTTPANNITITLTSVLGGKISTFTSSGSATGGRYVAIQTGSNNTAISTNGTTWVAGGNLPASTTWTSAASGVISNQTYYVAIASSGTQAASSIDDGATWTSRTLPASSTWTNVAFGNSRFIAIQNGSNNTAISTDGTTWTAGGTLPSSTNWSGVAYGPGVWVAIANGGTAAASSTNNGATWTARTLPSSGIWTSVTYGNGRFVAVKSSSADGAYSLDGITWTSMTLPSSSAWTKISYGQGLFFAVASGSTNAATSPDGINWTARTMPASGYNSIAFGNPNNNGVWTSVGTGAGTVAASIVTGATTQARAVVSSDGLLYQVRIIEPGSGYSSPPTMTITDPNNIVEASASVRTANGVLANPTFTNRGTGYLTALGTVVGDGFADFFQTGTYIYVEGLTDQPVPGSNIQFQSITGVYYKLVTVTQFLGSGPYTARLQISPEMGNAEAPAHGETVTIRIKYSQVRLTGHDFLDIGTGNFASTNYPGIPLIDSDKDKETNEFGGGRVFFTSTDQDGNFNVGDLFTVEQSTGVATLNADAFNIAGLQELQLGSVALGGTGATINEFSTDPTFAADSDSVVPTQRAIKAYITSQIGGGSGSLNVNTLTAGVIYIAGQSISTTTNVQINVNAKMNFTGGIDGSPVALNYFLLG